MAFQSKDLSVLAYANGFTLWHFTTADAAAEVSGASYFDAAADMLRAGDVILTNVEVATAPAAKLYQVAANANGAVTLAAL